LHVDLLMTSTRYTWSKTCQGLRAFRDFVDCWKGIPISRKILKISMPNEQATVTLDQYLGNSRGEIGSWTIHVNDGIQSADAWIVIEGTNEDDNLCVIPHGNLFFASAEVVHSDDYYLSQTWSAYFSQFDFILSCHPILIDNCRQMPPFLPWMINANHGNSIFAPHIRDINMLQEMSPLTKSKLMSVICSSKSFTAGHAIRLKFVEKLVEEFADEIDWYGNGINPLSEKWEGLADYKYTISIENRIAPRVITEKLIDPFLTFTLPLYAGAPDADVYFESRGFLALDFRDWTGSLRLVEQVLREDPYQARMPYLIDNRNRALNEFHFIKRLIREVERSSQSNEERQMRKVYSHHSFLTREEKLKQSISWRLRSMSRRFLG
jgi:hypothetical protein